MSSPIPYFIFIHILICMLFDDQIYFRLFHPTYSPKTHHSYYFPCLVHMVPHPSLTPVSSEGMRVLQISARGHFHQQYGGNLTPNAKYLVGKFLGKEQDGRLHNAPGPPPAQCLFFLESNHTFK